MYIAKSEQKRLHWCIRRMWVLTRQVREKAREACTGQFKLDREQR